MAEKILKTIQKTAKTLSKKVYLPKEEKLEKIFKSFSSSERFLFWILVILISFSSITLLLKVNYEFTVEVPRKGGEISEGVVGSPRFINPLLARSKADKDLVALVYSGLTRLNSEEEIIPDLSENWKVSEDKLTYTFKLKDNIYFQDGERVTADDIIFTIEKAKDPALESFQRANWDGIEVKKIDEKTISFKLKQPYSPFIKNTTIGIIPKHIWESLPSKQFSFSRFNIEPIGSGPFEFSKVNRQQSGMPKSYEFKSFKKFQGGEPYIEKLSIYFYPSQEKLIEGYLNKEIDQFHSISAKKTLEVIDRKSKIENTSLPRTFSLFYNQNKSDIFTSFTMREAIDEAINKKEIIETIFSGYADEINKPIPFWILKEAKKSNGTTTENRNDIIKNSKEKITSLKWDFNEEKGFFEKEEEILSFSITTSNIPELKETAHLIKKQLKEIGIDVKIEIFEESDLNQNVIRPRDYEALLFGEVIGPGIDLYPFWHSSKQNDPGLNMAMYANIEIDKLLENAREELNKEKRLVLQSKISKEISSEIPATFLYTPHFIYVLNNKIKGISIRGMAEQKDRFMNIADWYIKTEKVWKIFENKRI